ncbi:hypothetical protein BU17DRAFT_69395 [Hysterangium stoloniferum]|nr:hypothetical protein BU17DRAFT_69395 [Hysterangium stoloniferum]
MKRVAHCQCSIKRNILPVDYWTERGGIVTGDRNSDNVRDMGSDNASSDKVHWVGFQPNAYWQEREAGVIVQDRWRSGVQTTSLVGPWAVEHLSVKKGDGTIWPEELFCDELNILDRHLVRYGTIQPKGVNKLIISDSPVLMELFVQAENRLRNGLPKNVQDALMRHED